MSNVKYPNVKVELVGQDGNAFAILGRVKKAMKSAGILKDEIDLFQEEATKGDYNDLLATVMAWVDTIGAEDIEDIEDDDDDDDVAGEVLVCSYCGGSGEEECADCEGVGEDEEEGSCDSCSGSGTVDCDNCNGTGEVSS